MSEATKDLLDLANQLAKRWRPGSPVHFSILAYQLIERLDKNKRDRVLSSARLNSRLFLSEAANPERRTLHQAVINAAAEYKKAQNQKEAEEATRGISRANPR